jgi:ribose-phosphate pyrophosphokinase
VVSPDAGRVRMATEFAHRLNTSVVVLHKRRESGTQTKVTHGRRRSGACVLDYRRHDLNRRHNGGEYRSTA